MLEDKDFQTLGFLAEPSIEALQKAISSEVFHQMFWPELCQRHDFTLCRRTSYSVDELFVTHPILSQGFEKYDSSEEASEIGGVIDLYSNGGGSGVCEKSDYYLNSCGYPVSESPWYILEEYLSFYEYMNYFTDQSDTLADIADQLFAKRFRKEEDSLIAPFLVFALKNSADVSEDEKVPKNLTASNFFSKKYGFEFTDEVEDYLFKVYGYRGTLNICDFTTEVYLNDNFKNGISWSRATFEQKEQIYQWLLFGAVQDDFSVSETCSHFLSCIVLHGGTPPEIITSLQQMELESVQKVLEYVKSST